ncbi:hypothetical protein OROGR_024092 [Orobanche gracilis]
MRLSWIRTSASRLPSGELVMAYAIFETLVLLIRTSVAMAKRMQNPTRLPILASASNNIEALRKSLIGNGGDQVSWWRMTGRHDCVVPLFVPTKFCEIPGAGEAGLATRSKSLGIIRIRYRTRLTIIGSRLGVVWLIERSDRGCLKLSIRLSRILQRTPIFASILDQ